MNNSIKYILTFTAGMTAGVLLSWGYLKKKYEEITDEQIESVKEEFKVSREREAEQEMYQYNKLTSEYAIDSNSEEDAEEESTVKPHVITPEELGDVDQYDTTTLYYYADGVLVNLNDEVVEDVEGTVGLGFEKHFGEYEDDSVCIRNDKHMCDYEILRDSRNYADLKKPARPRDTEE